MGLSSVSILLFAAGIGVVSTRRAPVYILLGLELMLNAAGLNFVHFSTVDPDGQGQVTALFIAVIAVCETAVALGILYALNKAKQGVEV